MAEYETQLTSEEEVRFRDWFTNKAKQIGINPNPDDPQHYYDYRGAYKAGYDPMTAKNRHWPDTWKKPGHPTFSDESIYAIGVNKSKAGHWEKERYIPPKKGLLGTTPERGLLK